jgi:Xaa-Pro aminopeptidase
MLSREGCLLRTARLRDWCQAQGVDLAVISNEREAYYFSNFLRKPFGWLTTRLAFWGCSATQSFLVCSQSERRSADCAVADHLLAYRDYDIDGTTQTFLEHALPSLREALTRLGGPVRRIALEKRYAQVAVLETLQEIYPGASFVDASEAVLAMRKKKDPDEVEVLRRTAGLSGFCYQTAGEAIAPGRKDNDIYAACYEAYVRKMGEYVTFAGDFLAGEDTLKVTGGPSGRLLESGQTMILDLWLDPYGYWVDNARTFIVGPRPKADQERIYDLAIEALQRGEQLLRPGVRGREVYREMRQVYARQGLAEHFPGHAGHGLGLSPHERPLFIPASDDIVEEGDVVALEPGLYVPGIGGVRCEDNYLVARDGPRRLTDFERKIRWYKS